MASRRGRGLMPIWCCPICRSRCLPEQSHPGGARRALIKEQHEKLVAGFLTKSKLSDDLPLDGVARRCPPKTALRRRRPSLRALLTLLEKEYVDRHSGKRAAAPGNVPRPSCLPGLRRFAACSPKGVLAVWVARRSTKSQPCRSTAAWEFFNGLTFPPQQQPIGEPLVAEILKRLKFLKQVGVEYLSLDRPADSLSGGEMQRVRLATGIGSGLVGRALYFG